MYTLREFGKGAMAAASTVAVADRNLGLAFMVPPCELVISARETLSVGGKRVQLPALFASLRWHYPDQVKGISHLVDVAN